MIRFRVSPRTGACSTGLPSFWTHRHFNQEIDLDITNHVVGFCGRIYPVLHLNQSVRGEKNREKFCYTLQEVDDFVTQNFKEKYVEHYWLKELLYNRSRWPWQYRHQNFQKFFEDFDKEKDNYKKRFEEHNCPIFVGTLTENNREVVYHTNALNQPDPTNKGKYFNVTRTLKDVEFFRIFDPYQAFQELTMYLSNIAEPRKPIPHISDEDMVSIKGFDDKTSFRKPSSKRK
jgi:hypothetical protein